MVSAELRAWRCIAKDRRRCIKWRMASAGSGVSILNKGQDSTRRTGIYQRRSGHGKRRDPDNEDCWDRVVGGGTTAEVLYDVEAVALHDVVCGVVSISNVYEEVRRTKSHEDDGKEPAHSELKDSSAAFVCSGRLRGAHRGDPFKVDTETKAGRRESKVAPDSQFRRCKARQQEVRTPETVHALMSQYTTAVILALPAQITALMP